MITKPNVTLFICEHCRRAFQRQNACVNHEQWCNKNPVNIAKCSGCAFLQEKEKEIWHCGPYGDHSSISKSFFCTKKQIEVYPLKAAQMGLPDKYPEDFYEEIQMPNKCDHFEDNTGLPF